MNAITQNSKHHHILTNGGSSPSRDALTGWLTSWRQKIGYFSIFAALPAVFASQATEARAEDAAKQPEASIAGRTARFAERVKSCNAKHEVLRRQSEYRLPHQRGSFDMTTVFAGNDNCPGRVIPPGTYTAAAPYTDSGDTTGANNTVGAFYCYYCNGNVPGPDQIYTFRVMATGPNPQIQVTATSAGYDPAIYLLYKDGNYGECPSGTNNVAFNAMDWLYYPVAGSTEIIPFNLSPYWFGAPLHLFVDSALSGANSAGAYTIRMQDVTIAPQVFSEPRFDFDGDGRADISVFRPLAGVWYLNRSTQGFSATQWGLSTDKIVPGNFNGDRRTDFAVFRDGTWWLRYNYYYGYEDRVVQFGLPNDIPVPVDYNGDGRDELAVYRNGTWSMLDPDNNQGGTAQFGLAGDKPVPADYDGDGKTDFAVFRPSNRTWYIANSSNGSYTILAFGLATDKPVPGDYDGDGRTDLAVYRDGVWYLLQSTNGFTAFQFGLASDIPVPDDYDGDGKTDAAIYRNGQWWILQSTSGVSIQQFGLAGDKPVPAAYVP